MDHYLDIRLRPDPEFPPHQLMDAMFAKLHRTLAEQQRSDIGVSFPGMRAVKLGSTLRLHGRADSLNTLCDLPWLGGMREMVERLPTTPVPSEAQHRRVIRIQAKSSPERLRRRLMRRKQLTESEALARIPNSASERLNLPFLELTSRSTSQKFRLFLRNGPTQANPLPGSFNAYGLSQTATVPWF